MKFTTNCLSFLLLTTLLLSESTNGLINSHTLIANTANIKRNAVTAADDPIDKTITHYGVPQTDSATRSQSSMTAETATSTVSAHNNGNQLQIVTGAPIIAVMGLVLGLF